MTDGFDLERELNRLVVTRTSRRLSFYGVEHDVRTSEGRASLDAALVRVLRDRTKSHFVRSVVVNHTKCHSGGYNSYDRNMKILQESIDRLVVAGKVLPLTRDGHLIPCH